jgi:hypothetical protein
MFSSSLSEDATAVSDGAGDAEGAGIIGSIKTLRGRLLYTPSILSVFYFLFPSIKKAFFFKYLLDTRGACAELDERALNLPV